MKKRGISPQKYLILENIRSVHNAGSIFRTADAVGIDKIYLIGYTPAPLDRFGRERKDFHKAALGAEKKIDWEQIKKENAESLIKKLKEEKIKTIALEQDPQSVDYKKIKNFIKNEDVALILGNEVEGVSQKVLNAVDHVVEIPMFGSKESLNVSVSAGIAMYSIFD